MLYLYPGRSKTPIPEPRENVEIGINNDVAVPVNKHKDQPSELCYTWSEVKLYRLTNSELEKYLGKINLENTTNESSKGDNVYSTLHQSVTNSLPHPAYSRTGRPLCRAATKSTYVDSYYADSDMSDDVPKVCNKTNPS